MPETGEGKETGLDQSPNVSEENIDVVERETIDKVNHTITVLEGVMATWDAAKEKPLEMSDRFDQYRRFLDALLDWESRALKARSKGETFQNRVNRLREFVDMCYAYA